jgi:hypothetical protein
MSLQQKLASQDAIKKLAADPLNLFFKETAV